MSDSPSVLTQQQDGIATVTLNRPEQRNAIDQEMIDGLHAALGALETQLVGDDDAPRVMVLHGAGGKAFAAGADIGQLRERGALDALARINQGLFNRVEALPIPTIAAVEGWCLGGGCELSMACDLRVAARDARFGQPEVGLGIIPGAGGPRRLVELVGLGKARELIFTGAIIDAETAASLGLVNRITEKGEALEGALGLAAEIAKQGPLAVRVAKTVVNAGVRGGASSRDAMEFLAQSMLFESEDKRARMGDFLRKQEERRAAKRAAQNES